MLLRKNKFSKLSIYSIGLSFLLIGNSAYAVVIGPNTVINSPVTYSETDIDLTGGNFVVREGGSLTIENSTITGAISGENPYLISVELGSLNLKNNKVSIDATCVTPTPKTEASFYAIRLGRATASLVGNTFDVNQQFSTGLLTTSLILPSKNVVIDGNSFQNFHGVAYLLNSFNTKIENNYFNLNSSGQIVIVGSQSMIRNNDINFAGINQLGDAIDVVDAESVTIQKNHIFTPTSLGIGVVLSKNVVIDRNTITGGITYAINILSNSEMKNPAKENVNLAKIVSKLGSKKMLHLGTADILISNNFLGQNRYGITAVDVNGLTVTGNYFTQRFADSAARKFWTDNNVLLKNVSNISWENNYYKEAFSQVNGGDNSMTNFVPFPASGGVVLN